MDEDEPNPTPEERVVPLDELTAPQRNIVLALIAAKKAADEQAATDPDGQAVETSEPQTQPTSD